MASRSASTTPPGMALSFRFAASCKQLKDATQGHLDDAWKVDGAELHHLKIAGNVIKVEEQSMLTKFDTSRTARG